MSDARDTPAERLEALTSLYERQAYVAWNVALRIALEEGAAKAAARRAFLIQVAHPDEDRVPLDTARVAAEGGSTPDPREIDDPVLAAAARLSPPERAVLALAALTEASGEQVAAAFGIEPAVERELHARGCEQLGVLLDVSPAEAEAAYADLPWIEPPEDLWAELYPEMHGAVTRHARSEARDEAAPAPQGRSPGPLHALRRVPRVALVGVAVLAVAGVAWAASGGGSDGEDPAPGADRYSALTGAPGEPAYPDGDESDGGTASAARDEPLTPEQLDRLRREEIEDLERYTRQKADSRLPPRKRRRAARKVDDLVKLAQQRQRAAERRELAARLQLAREREARMRERRRRQEADERSEPTPRDREPAEQPEDTRPKPRPQPRPPDDDDGGGDGGDSEDQAECLYDPQSGEYICPE